MVKQLADDYANQPAVFLEDLVDRPVDSFHYSAWWAAYGGGFAYLPLILVGSGNQHSMGSVSFYNVYKGMVDTEIARAPGAEISGVWKRSGDGVHATVTVTNKSGVTLSNSNSAKVSVVVYETGSVGMTGRLVRGYANADFSTGLANGATARLSLDVTTLPVGVNWNNLHVIALVDYWPSGWTHWDNLQTAALAQPGIGSHDLDLDSLQDLVARNSTGTVNGLVSTGSAFNSTSWTTGFVSYRYDVYVADVDGDGRADLVSRSKDNGNVEVFRSTGTAFAYAAGSGPGGVWTYGWGTSYDLYFADVTGDGKADLVGRLRSSGEVTVFASTGSGFSYSAGSGPGGLWSYGWSSGYDLYFADVTGDGKADLVSRYYGPTAALTGDVYIGASTGSGFASPQRWSYGYSAGYDLSFDDVDGDGKADMVSRYYGPTVELTGDVYVMLSTGTGFAWTLGSGRMTYGWGSTYELLFRDVTGDGKADLVSRRSDTGQIEVAPWSGTGFTYSGVWATGVGSGWELR